MNNKKINNNKIQEDKREEEFIPSVFNWISLKEQKEKVKRFENITKKD